MAVARDRLSIAPEVADAVEDLDGLLSRLTAWDCQTCGREIGEAECSLALGPHPARPDQGLAALHHASCRPSQITPGGGVRTAATVYSGGGLAHLLPGQEAPQSVVVVNTQLEHAYIRRTEAGWRPMAMPALRQAGMLRATPTPPSAEPYALPPETMRIELAVTPEEKQLGLVTVRLMLGGDVLCSSATSAQAMGPAAEGGNAWVVHSPLWGPDSGDELVLAELLGARDALMAWVSLPRPQ